MFKLIRLPVFVAIAFIAGIFHERQAMREACEARGEWQDGLCLPEGSGN